MADTKAGRRVLVDACILISHLRHGGKPGPTELEQAASRFDDLVITAVTAYEVECGARAAKRGSDLAHILPVFEIVAVTFAEADQAAKVYAEQLRGNMRMSSPDAIVAGTARLHGLPLLTSNLKHFEGIEGLRVAGTTAALLIDEQEHHQSQE